MEHTVRRLQSLRPIVSDICNISGTTGASIGVLHHGKIIHTTNVGFRDVEAQLEPDSDTIYYLSSLTKSFTAAAVAILVHRGRLDWETPISHLLPKLQHRDPKIRKHATAVDFMSHRTGLTPKNHIWAQEYGHLSLRHEDTIKTVTYLDTVHPFRSRWLYSNWGYALADNLIESLSGKSWGTFVTDEILVPLGMDRTIFGTETRIGNIAEAYMSLSTGESHHLPLPEGGDGTILEGALTVRSSVNDLLKYYGAFLYAIKDQNLHGESVSLGSPFVDVKTMLTAHIPLSPEPSALERSYGLGWVRTQLPGPLGAIGLNEMFVKKMPIVGKGLEQPQLCIYHQGCANTFLTSVYLLPETDTAVIVLTNSMAKNDSADWLGELYIQAILDNPEKNDYTAIARASAAASMELWPAMVRELESQRIPNTHSRQLNAYVGTYVNIIGNYQIVVFEEGGSLAIRFQRERKISYSMRHYHYDVFSWLLTHDQDVAVGRFPVPRASYYLMKFEAPGPTQEINRLIWANDDEVLEGETFFKIKGEKLEKT